ncbi:Suppressor of fused protein (SUFU) [Paenibacillus sp. yr247]|uniref:suppressor of fused domain protein n=1 Tax=Paenibacillus sp. yr247 TaxID=1761880 RepID=UPI00088B8466|nr:suppressor of fused domain protein [Paenibacillus sp. yr247]SDP25301.1 Suppressor of fused protein (SUFU) [Paenibacillus sp. yr247]
MNSSEQHKTIAKTVVKAFGGTPNVIRYYDDNNESSVEVLSCADRPWNDVVSYSTMRLSDHSIDLSADDVPLRVELLGACNKEFDLFPNILATCAFNVIKTNFPCHPGAIYPNVVRFYMPESPLKDIMLVSPFLWDDKLSSIHFSDKTVTWLMVVPISEAESKYAKEHGTDALEEMFERHQIKVFDLMRTSIVR